MAFRFTLTAYPGEDRTHGDGDWYEFGPGGVLGVHYGDTERDSEYYSPNTWTGLYTNQPPGKPTDGQVWGFFA